MPLETITRRPFAQPDRAEVQERIARQVEHDPERFLAMYTADPRSFGGRYVNSDLMKETFPEYRESPEARNRYNAPVHNAAAVLASEQYRRAIANDSDSSRDTAVFLTGIPGAGKTTSVLQGGELPRYVRVIYEGQLANPEHALPKVAQALDAGLRPRIYAVHIQSERAFQNTLHRFETEGRGASIEAMASIQGRLPEGLRAIQARFGDSVELFIFDRRDKLETKRLRGWQHLPQLESQGNYEHIKHHLTAIIEREYREGRIREEAYDQAIGRAPGEVSRRVERQNDRGIERSDKAVSAGLVNSSSSPSVSSTQSTEKLDQLNPPH